MGSSQSEHIDTVKQSSRTRFIHYAPAIGVALVLGGILLFIDQKIKSGWIPLSLPVVAGLVIIAYGYVIKNNCWLFTGFSLTAIAGALFLIFQPFIVESTFHLLAYGLGFFSLMWLCLFLSLGFLKQIYHWWIIFIVTISLALSMVFVIGRTTLLTFILAISLAISLTFLVWGSAKKSIGLLIPGLLVGTIGTGVFNGWDTVGDVNGLRDTGIMLVWFSLGWILITVGSRILQKRFIWWPLIPGGVFAMVGSGLYIGGNPTNAAAFLQNTGSIALIILGIYLILLKFGLKK